jgi:hypothetical protein
MRSSSPKIEFIIANPHKFVQVEYGDYEKTAKMEVVCSEGGRDIPRVHYTWTPEFLITTNAEEAKALESHGFKPEYRENKFTPAESYWSLTVQLKDKVRHLWFMNFRRYGWSWTDEEAGENGYCAGHTYANGTAIAGLATTPSEVIRDSLVVSWATLKARHELPTVFLCREAEAVLKFLLDDAIANMSEHAHGRRDNGAAVSFLPEMSINIPGRVEKQPGRKISRQWPDKGENKSLFGV